MIEILFIAVGLAMDALAVSIASGTVMRDFSCKEALKISLSFGLVQAGMPVLGWAAGLHFRKFMGAWDHWVASGLLFAIGIKMIWEARGEERKPFDPTHPFVLFILSIATSLDALGVGLSLSFIGVSIFLPAFIIGMVTFSLCLPGVYMGKRAGTFLEGKIEILGGVILMGIGVKILVEHLLT